MNLYYAPLAPNPDRVKFFLQEKGVWEQTPKTEINIVKQEHKTPAYLALSPLNQVPVLEIDNEPPLTERANALSPVGLGLVTEDVTGSFGSRLRTPLTHVPLEIVTSGTLG